MFIPLMLQSGSFLTSGPPFLVGANFPPAIDPAGQFLYVPNEASSVLTVLAIDRATGGFSFAQTPSVHVGDGPSSVGIDPTGRYLYVVNRRDQTISQFTVGTGGNLTPMAVPLVSDPGQPWQILVDPSGQLAYVSNEQTASVTIYRIGAAGELIQYGSAAAGQGAGGMGIARRH
jgi:DNA-binding beta-propeller fold protein YncE